MADLTDRPFFYVHKLCGCQIRMIKFITFLASLSFTCAFLFGKYFRSPKHPVLKRTFLSFGAGMSVAYIFIHVLPVLENMRRAAELIPDMEHPFHGLIVYVAAMLGFILFYGIDRAFARVESIEETLTTNGFIKNEALYFIILHMSGFGIYVWLVSYFLVRGAEPDPLGIGLYTLAMLLHLLNMNNTFRNQYGDRYHNWISRFMALCVLTGWLCGIFFELPEIWLIALVSLVAGAILVNTMIGELSHNDEGIFIPFFGGALLFSILLLAVH